MAQQGYEEVIDDFHRTINYFRLYRYNPGRRNRKAHEDSAAPKNWLDAMAEVQDFPMEQRTVNDIVYEVQVDRKTSTATIGMHKRLDPSLMSRIDIEGQSIGDFKLEQEGSGVRLAHASAVAIKEITGTLVVAIARGSSITVPRQVAVSAFFNHFFGDDSTKWKHKGIIVAGDLELLKRTNRIKSYYARFIESPNTLEGELAKGSGPRGASRRVAQDLGGEIEVNLHVKDSKQDLKVQEKMLEQVLSANKGHWEGSVHKAIAVIDDEDVVLDLIEHDMASTIYFSPERRVGLSFSNLLVAVKNELLRLDEEIQAAVLTQPSNKK